jgi:hypothetical protein
MTIELGRISFRDFLVEIRLLQNEKYSDCMHENSYHYEEIAGDGPLKDETHKSKTNVTYGVY